jgi:hypothetical protein
MLTGACLSEGVRTCGRFDGRPFMLAVRSVSMLEDIPCEFHGGPLSL